MPKEIKPPITITTGSGESRTFADTADLQAFAAGEQGFWSFLNDVVKSGRPFANEARWPLARLGTLIGTLSDFEAGRTPVDELRNQVLTTYSNEREKIPTSDSADAQAIKSLAEQLPSDVFLIAATTILRRWSGQAGAPTLNNYDQWMGFLTGMHYRLGLSPVVAKAQVAALEQLREQHATALVAEETKLQDIQNIWSKALDEFQAQSNERLEAGAKADAERTAKADAEFKELLGLRQTEHMEARAQWQATHNAFTEQLHLKAPKEYWEDKRIRHRKRAKLWGGIALGYGLAALLGMIVGIQFEYWEIRALPPETPVAAYVVLAARGVLISVVAFWIARVLVRMYLSELHLGMDAFERSTMVSTYLALVQDGTVTQEERTLALAPLFRATADGLVKDDASVDPLMYALFGKPQPKQQ